MTALFCVENLKEMAGDAAAAQRQPLVGIWDADMTDFHKIPEYANASLYCVLNADGTGSTYLDLAGTGDFLNTDNYQFFAYDNDGNAETNSGVYLPANEAEGSVSAGYYALTKKDGKDILTFTTLEGEVISYIRRETAGENRDENTEGTDNKEDSTNTDSEAKVVSFSSGGLKYKVLSDGTVQVTGVKKKAKKVTIPATVKDGKGTSYKVTKIAKNAFKKDTTITSVTIGKNVTSIGASAFQGGTKLKTITIKGSSLKKIGKKAFTSVPKKAVAKVPKKQKTAYQKLLKSAGFKGTVK